MKKKRNNILLAALISVCQLSTGYAIENCCAQGYIKVYPNSGKIPQNAFIILELDAIYYRNYIDTNNVEFLLVDKDEEIVRTRIIDVANGYRFCQLLLKPESEFDNTKTVSLRIKLKESYREKYLQMKDPKYEERFIPFLRMKSFFQRLGPSWEFIEEEDKEFPIWLNEPFIIEAYKDNSSVKGEYFRYEFDYVDKNEVLVEVKTERSTFYLKPTDYRFAFTGKVFTIHKSICGGNFMPDKGITRAEISLLDYSGNRNGKSYEVFFHTDLKIGMINFPDLMDRYSKRSRLEGKNW